MPPITAPFDTLALNALRKALQVVPVITAAQWVEHTGSTNTDLLTDPALLTPGPGFAVRGALFQTAGRGRAGRAWAGQSGDSLMFSIGFHWTYGLQALSGLSLAIGVGLAHALDPVTSQQPAVRIKWPNDLWLITPNAFGKCGGILIESVAAGGGHWVVVGCGINLSNSSAFNTDETNPRADLTQAGLADSYHTYALKTVSACIHTVQDFARQGLQGFLTQYQQRDALRGLPISVEHDRQMIHGIVQGCDPRGHLLMMHGDTPITIAAGQVQTQLSRTLIAART